MRQLFGVILMAGGLCAQTMSDADVRAMLVERIDKQHQNTDHRKVRTMGEIVVSMGSQLVAVAHAGY